MQFAASMPRIKLWMHLLVIACLIISRRPDALLYPQFWGEDGQAFYHDAYTIGLSALWHPLGGYLNTLSRLVALFAVQFPVAWGPTIYVLAAFAVQMLPVWLFLSPRLAAVLPSLPARLIIAYFYAAEPNSYEVNLNLTDAQWHLGMAAFLLLTATPAVGALSRLRDLFLLALSSLSGPFAIFLVPIAWTESWQKRDRPTFNQALVVSAAVMVQLGCMAVTHASGVRSSGALNASLLGFAQIATNQMIIGGLLGYHWTSLCLTWPMFGSPLGSIIALLCCCTLMGSALITGPSLYRKAAFWSAAMFGAALASPLLCSWTLMTVPGINLRYYLMPTLVWFATLMIAILSPQPILRVICYVMFAMTLLGIYTEWRNPPFQKTNFYAQAKIFRDATKGQIITFSENPHGWAMTLTKQ